MQRFCVISSSCCIFISKAHFACLIYNLELENFSCSYCLLNSEVQHCQVLSDDKKRALYDQYGEAGVKSTVGGPSGAYTVREHIYICYILCLFCLKYLLEFFCTREIHELGYQEQYPSVVQHIIVEFLRECFLLFVSSISRYSSMASQYEFYAV